MLKWALIARPLLVINTPELVNNEDGQDQPHASIWRRTGNVGITVKGVAKHRHLWTRVTAWTSSISSMQRLITAAVPAGRLQVRIQDKESEYRKAMSSNSTEH